MRRYGKLAVAVTVLTLVLVPAWSQGHAQRWSEAQANAWYAKQPWLVGSNYVPTNAINELEMWQAETFDPQQIDKELGWAEGLGMNTMRVFLHDLLWKQDSAAFTQRIDTFLTIADKHHIHPVFVLFDSCWEPDPKLGPQHPPIPGRAQFGMGAESGRAGAQGCIAISATERLRAWGGGCVRKR